MHEVGDRWVPAAGSLYGWAEACVPYNCAQWPMWVPTVGWVCSLSVEACMASAEIGLPYSEQVVLATACKA
jgi:hypothetical protein